MILLPLLSGCNLYLVQASRGQLDLLWRRVPVAEALKNPALKPTHRDSLLFLEEVRQFAINSGLNASGMYTSFTAIERSAAAYNVTAAPPLQLEAKTWWFPIVGSVPYLGYFSKEGAVKKELELKAQGYDTRLRDVPAYSTLGWFDDPVLSSQLDCSRLCLSRIFLHEAAHATLWLNGSVGFNESFASFVAEKAARQFWALREGSGSPTLQTLDLNQNENKILTRTMSQCSRRLKNLYLDLEKGQVSAETAIQSKERIIQECKNALRKARFRTMRLDNWLAEEWNNTHFLAHARYQSGEDFFIKNLEKCHGDWACFFRKMATLKDLPLQDREKALEKASLSQD